MKTSLLLLISTLLFAANANALDILCVDREIQDNQITAHFRGSGTNMTVTLTIPTAEFAEEKANGTCVAEEDTEELSLRCENLKSSGGDVYFARIDGNEAIVAHAGQVIATFPCDADKDNH